MDERDLQVFARFRRQAAIYVLGMALIVAVVVSGGVRMMLMSTYGRMISSGLRGVVSATIDEGDTLAAAAVRGSLERSFKGLAKEGSFNCLTMIDADGNVLASSDERPCGCVTAQTESGKAAIRDGKVRSVISRDDDDERILMVIAPIATTQGGKPEGAIIASRPFGLIAASLNGTLLAITGTVLLGAAGALALVLNHSKRAEAEVARRDELVSALHRRLAGSLNDLERHSLGTLQALSAAVDAKDSYTARHSLNVADYACAIARSLGHDDLVPQLEQAGLLHDIGKIGVGETVLAKPTKLSKGEFASVKEHARVGSEIIAAIPFLEDVVPIVLHHHERFDGGGYPDGLAGEEIPLGARILAVADAFDAMTTVRPYDDAKTVSESLRELRNGRGTQFDPVVADALIGALESRSVQLHTERFSRTAS